MREHTRLLCQKVTLLIYQNPNAQLYEIAHSIGTDRHKIQSAIKENYGIKFGEFKKRNRLKVALDLITNEVPARSVKEIATSVGLSPNHLSRLVKLVTGRSATDLRCLKE